MGDYAAANLLMCLGRYELIPMDSWARKLIRKEFYPERERIGKKEMTAAFARFGEWKFLAYWFYKWNR